MAAGAPDGGQRLVLLLALGAGAVDAMVIVGFQVLTAAQTGNTILLAVALAQGEWRTGLVSGLSVLGFLLGALAGSAALSRAGWGIGRLLLLEVAVLAGALGLWLSAPAADPVAASGVVAITAAAMGLQSAVMLHLRASSTTYVTGVLAAFARGLVAPREPQASPTRPAWLEGVVWAVYFAGAFGGASLFIRHGPLVMVLPLACLAVASLVAPRPGAAGA